MSCPHLNIDGARKAIVALLDSDFSKKYDDGSVGPVLVRLAWHASGTYKEADGTGGSDGATMRFEPESKWGANAGLDIARNMLEPIKRAYPNLSYADLYTLSSVVAIEHMGGPKISWQAGRKDATNNAKTVEDGRLPDASKKEDHIRGIFNRMGFTDREIVALAGAHCIGRCHPDRSGYTGVWTFAPTKFTNLYFKELLNRKWTVKKWDGPLQYEDATGKLMMLPADLAFLDDKEFRKYVELYAKDKQAFFEDFSAAYAKLLSLGCTSLGVCPAMRKGAKL